MIRYYFELSPSAVEKCGGYQYLTAAVPKPAQGYFPRLASSGSPASFHQLLSNSDRVILCDEDAVTFVKNRREDATTAVVDPDEFFEIKMRSIDIANWLT
jgi:hypothetical protein